MTSADPLVALADTLYAEPVATFTSVRDTAAKAATDKELGKRIKALRKPSIAAWAVNLLVRREGDQIDQVLTLAAALRDAAESMDGAELRALTRQRRQLTHALTTTARSLAREHGVRLTEAVADQVEGVLNAAMLDPVAAEVLRSGLLVTSFAGTGVSTLDVDRVLAVPDALGARAGAVSEPERVPLHVVPEDDALRRERAQDALDAAVAAVTETEKALEAAQQEVAQWNAQRLQTREELDELRRRIGELETSAEQADAELEEAEANRDEAQAEVVTAQQQRDRARRALAAID